MKLNNFTHKNNQNGIALISAMLIVALATVITVSISFDQSLIVRKSSHLQNRVQSYQYITGLEDWVGTILEKDARDTKTDDLNENWSLQLPPLPIDRGYLSGFIEDEQAKFNLNSLLSSTEMLTRFRLLCEHLDIEKEFIMALLDWMDSDVDVRYPDGAEDDYYSSLDVPYKTSNQLMTDVTELLLIKGVTQEMFDTLKPFITVLPEKTPLNINTLSKEVFLSLDKTLEKKHFDDFESSRADAPFKSIKEMTSTLKININEKMLSVDTHYFWINGEVLQDESIVNFYTLMKRKNKKVSVLYRRLGL